MWKSRRFGNWNQIWPGFKAISAASATANHALRGTNIALRSQSKNIWTLFCFCAFALKRHTSNHLPMVLFIFHFWWQERKGILEQILWIAVWRLQHWKSGINNINGKGSSGRKGDHNLFCTLKLWYISMKRIFKTYLRSANNAFVGQSWKYFCTKLYFFTLAPLHCNYIVNTKVGKKKWHSCWEGWLQYERANQTNRPRQKSQISNQKIWLSLSGLTFSWWCFRCSIAIINFTREGREK